MKRITVIAFMLALAVAARADWRGAFDDHYFAQVVVTPPVVYSWTEVRGLPWPRGRVGAAVLGEYLYVIGGDNTTNTARYDGTEWIGVAGPPDVARGNYPNAAALGSYIYFFGGDGNKTNCSRFDGADWDGVAGPPAAIAYGAASVYKTNILASGATTNYYKFAPPSWSSMAASAYSSSSASTEYGDYWYKIGGYEYPSNTFRYNGTSWDQVALLPIDRGWGTAVSYEGLLYFIGGTHRWPTWSGTHSNVFVFNETSWSETNSLPAPRQYPQAVVYKGAIYVIAGKSETANTTNVFRWGP